MELAGPPWLMDRAETPQREGEATVRRVGQCQKECEVLLVVVAVEEEG
jgi:hypothetical protein